MTSHCRPLKECWRQDPVDQLLTSSHRFRVFVLAHKVLLAPEKHALDLYQRSNNATSKLRSGCSFCMWKNSSSTNIPELIQHKTLTQLTSTYSDTKAPSNGMSEMPWVSMRSGCIGHTAMMPSGTSGHATLPERPHIPSETVKRRYSWFIDCSMHSSMTS